MRGGIRPNQTGRPPAENSRAKDREAKAAAMGKSGRPRLIDDGVWVTLPYEGRGGNPPAWPLSIATKREREIWRRLWKLPEAMAWETTGSTFQVALHVRTLARAEQPDAPIAMVNQLRLQMDGLGLTPYGKKMLRWRVGQSPRVQQQAVAAAAPADQQPSPVPQPAGTSPRDRLRVVPHVAG